MDVLQRLAALEQSPLGEWARTSAYGYPLVNVIHLLGLVMLLGAIGLLDLRLLGLFRSLPATAVAKSMIPVAATGLLLLAASGIALFSADAGPLLKSPRFLLKMGLIGVALANVAAFHLAWRGRLDGPISPVLRMLSAASLTLWLSIATLGRLIAYS